jgi:sulfite exporter TauE/SafE/copper chaperone CopZ
MVMEAFGMTAKQQSGWKMLQLKVGGMHCANCEVLIERRFKKIAGVRRVKVDHVTGRAAINCYGDLDMAALQGAIADDGYTVSRLHEENKSPSGSWSATNTDRDYVEIVAAFFILAGVYIGLAQFDLLPQNLGLPNEISYGLAFLIGIVASISSCIAVTGGLLVAIAAKYNEATAGLSPAQRFRPHLFFNAGRVVSYTLLGGAIGALGSTFTMSPEASGMLMILASGIMIVLGLQMLNLFPWLKRLQPRMPKFLAHRIHDLTEKEVKGGAFILGASTFFLPCGFTQALQLYVLAKGSFTVGALTMLAFALGTLPGLLSLSMMSSFATGTFQRYFLKLAGAAVVLLGIFNIESGLTLAGVATGTSATAPVDTQQASQAALQPVPIVDGKQIVDMRIIGYSYQPNRFVVVQGVPVEWRIDARVAAGCGHIIIVPRIGVRRFLPSNEPAVISFTPQAVGEIGFNCAMGMMTRGSKINVIQNPNGKSVAL